MSIYEILNDLEDDVYINEEEARLELERCKAKRELIDDIINRLVLEDKKEDKKSTYRDAERAKAYRTLCRRA